MKNANSMKKIDQQRLNAKIPDMRSKVWSIS